MKRLWATGPWIAIVLIVGSITVQRTASAREPQLEIVHDAEYYVLATQHGDQWAAEDQEISQRLAALRQK